MGDRTESPRTPHLLAGTLAESQTPWSLWNSPRWATSRTQGENQRPLGDLHRTGQQARGAQPTRPPAVYRVQ